MNQENVKVENKAEELLNSVATLAAGCFWCVEAVFQKLKGVEKVESGYMGGTLKNPTYKDVCTGQTGHAEVCQISFNPTIISFEELLEVFWKTHDPTTLNRQGGDIGTQYRSAVFYHDAAQKQIAENIKNDLSQSGAFDAPIVTTFEPLSVFYKAENYHQDYFNLNGTNPYCQMVVKPKVEKFKKVFGDRIK
jgi:peptide-methionine (S)-S-oxide reductase